MINEEIRDKEIRVINSEGEMLGVMTSKQALELAFSNDLDLVKIVPNSNPPVCKIMDYGKYRFELAKKEREAKKNQKIIEIKEIRVSPSIETHDFEFKLRNAKKFLESGNKLKLTVRFRGRELNYIKLGENVLQKFANELESCGIIEKPTKLEGKNMSLIMSPKN